MDNNRLPGGVSSGWPFRHPDPLRNRCAVARRLALIEFHMSDLEDQIPTDFDFMHAESTMSDHENRIAQLES